MNLASIVFAVCTPASIAEYRRHLSEPERHDFAARRCGDELIFRDVVLAPLERLRMRAADTGASIRTGATLHDIARILAAPRIDCTIVIAHTRNQEIELSDGLVAFSQFADAIPEGYSGVLDLTCCHSEPLGALIRDRRPGIGPIKSSTATMHYPFWMAFYEGVLMRMQESGADYWQAYEDVSRICFNHTRGRVS